MSRNTSFGSLGWFYLWWDSGLFAACDAVSNLHRHYAFQITYPFSPPCRIRTDTESPWNEWSGFIVLPGHRFQAQVSGRFATVYIDVNHPRYWNCKDSTLANSAVNGIAPLDVSPGLITELNELYEGGFTSQSAKHWIDGDVIDMFNPSSGRGHIDPRILKIMSHIETALPQRVPVETLASLIGLSPNHVMNLFKQETGITIRRYTLWRRLKSALINIANGENFTQSAHNAAFSDSAHLTRTFYDMFGFNPSTLFSAASSSASMKNITTQ